MRLKKKEIPTPSKNANEFVWPNTGVKFISGKPKANFCPTSYLKIVSRLVFFSWRWKMRVGWNPSRTELRNRRGHAVWGGAKTIGKDLLSRLCRSVVAGATLVGPAQSTLGHQQPNERALLAMEWGLYLPSLLKMLMYTRSKVLNV